MNHKGTEAQSSKAATETERGHSCPQQRPTALPLQKSRGRSSRSTLLRTGMSALHLRSEFPRTLRISWETVVQRRISGKIFGTNATCPFSSSFCLQSFCLVLCAFASSRLCVKIHFGFGFPRRDLCVEIFQS